MIKVCSWCKKPMGTTDDHKEGDETITHVVCKECRKKWEEEARKLNTNQ
jgi:predicted metal-binding protein